MSYSGMEMLVTAEEIKERGTIISVRITSILFGETPIAFVDYSDAESIVTTHDVAQPLFDEQLALGKE